MPTADQLKRWAGSRHCLLCNQRGDTHGVARLQGSRGVRLALISQRPSFHEFDPGDRRVERICRCPVVAVTRLHDDGCPGR